MNSLDLKTITSETVILELSPLALQQAKMVEMLSSISKPQKLFLLIAIELAKKAGESPSGVYLIGRTQIQNELLVKKKGASDSLISKRFFELKELGVCTVEIHLQPNRKKVNHYTINDLSPLANLIPKEPSKKKKGRTRTSKGVVICQQEFFKNESKGLLLSNPSDLIFFNEQLFNGILDICTRISGKDSRKTIEITFKIGGYPLTVTSSCSAKVGQNLLLMTDQRAMRSIISYCKKEVHYFKLKLKDKHGAAFDNRLIPNLFHIDIYDLCKLMGLKCVNASLDIVVGMMDRLSDTTFEIDASKNPWFQENFSMMFKESNNGNDPIRSDRYKLRFLNDFESAKENDKLKDLFNDELNNLRPRFYTFSLETRLFYSLIQDNQYNLFKSHDGLSKERSGIVHRFYGWARAAIGGRAKFGIENKWFTVSELHQALTPGNRLDNFHSYFMRALKNHATSDNWEKGVGGESLIYGYFIHYKRENGDDLFNIRRDISDPIVGDNSKHNSLIRKDKIEILEGVVVGEEYRLE
jgi:hypothetical protein